MTSQAGLMTRWVVDSVLMLSDQPRLPVAAPLREEQQPWPQAAQPMHEVASHRTLLRLCFIHALGVTEWLLLLAPVSLRASQLRCMEAQVAASQVMDLQMTKALPAPCTPAEAVAEVAPQTRWAGAQSVLELTRGQISPICCGMLSVSSLSVRQEPTLETHLTPTMKWQPWTALVGKHLPGDLRCANRYARRFATLALLQVPICAALSGNEPGCACRLPEHERYSWARSEQGVSSWSTHVPPVVQRMQTNPRRVPVKVRRVQHPQLPSVEWVLPCPRLEDSSR